MSHFNNTSINSKFLFFSVYSKRLRRLLKTARTRTRRVSLPTTNSKLSRHRIMLRHNRAREHNHYHKIISNNQWDRFRHQIVLRLVHVLCLRLWVSFWDVSPCLCTWMNYLLGEWKTRNVLMASLVHFLLGIAWKGDKRLFTHSTLADAHPPRLKDFSFLLLFFRLLYKRKKNWKWYGLIRGVKNVCNHKNV